MDTISSAAFRKVYAKLDRPTIVTVNGHAIGVWSPYLGPTGAEPVPAEVSTFSSRPFTPVPKRR